MLFPRFNQPTPTVGARKFEITPETVRNPQTGENLNVKTTQIDSQTSEVVFQAQIGQYIGACLGAAILSYALTRGVYFLFHRYLRFFGLYARIVAVAAVGIAYLLFIKDQRFLTLYFIWLGAILAYDLVSGLWLNKSLINHEGGQDVTYSKNMFCTYCGKTMCEDANFCAACGRHAGGTAPPVLKVAAIKSKPVDALRVVDSESHLASFWTRFGAFFVDYIIAMVLAVLIIKSLDISESESNFIGALAILVYHLFSLLLTGMTLGKRLFGLHIVDSKTGGKITSGQIIKRTFSYLLSFLLFGYGFWRVLFRDDMRTWHDETAGTKVVG